MGLFVTGTDTDVGKSVASSWLLHQLRGYYWKPVQSGLQGETDRQMVMRLSGLPGDHFLQERYSLQLPRSPHEAARKEGVTIQLTDFCMPSTPAPLVVEGAGGVMVPLNEHHLMVDLMVHLQLPVVLVCRTALGTINHTLLSLQALRHRGLTVVGVILNGEGDEENLQAIKNYGNVKILAHIPKLSPLDQSNLARIPPLCNDWPQCLSLT
ncbi:MAG: dethiobiotin synthase [Magnetococcales bacterium]|nr:dethiobiotin synthase [Magnetococcales bacterium]NGZ26970.1 dethiobiotin synthase [Magnetococcales bacterium]